MPRENRKAIFIKTGIPVHEIRIGNVNPNVSSMDFLSLFCKLNTSMAIETMERIIL